MTKIQEIQTILGVKADGNWGPKSQAALELAKAKSFGMKPPKPPVLSTGEKVDDRSETAISTLHRIVQPKARQLVNLAAANGITIKITSGTRTYDEQDALFRKGNVTKARGGFSNHNFGLAFDVTIFQGSSPVWESPKYKTLGVLGKSIGFSWGGDWKSFEDEPHFQLEPKWAEGMSESQMLAELRRRRQTGIDVFA